MSLCLKIKVFRSVSEQRIVRKSIVEEKRMLYLFYIRGEIILRTCVYIVRLICNVGMFVEELGVNECNSE